MDLLQLTYFCDAAQTENFSKTATKFLVPPSNISQTINRLEKELGSRLFNREPNRVTLNKVGAEFYEKIHRALDLIDEGKQTVQDTISAPAGEIKILVHTCRRIVTKAVQVFKSAFPNVMLVIHHTKSSGNGNYDFIISDQTIGINLPKKHLLLSEPIMLACNRKHKLTNLDLITAQHLLGEKFITMSEGNSLHDILTRICKNENVPLNIAIQSDDPFYVRKYLDEGLGLAFVPAISWMGTFLDNTRLTPFGKYTRETFVFHDRPEFMLNVQKQFLTYLKTAFEQETRPAD